VPEASLAEAEIPCASADPNETLNDISVATGPSPDAAEAPLWAAGWWPCGPVGGSRRSLFCHQ
jgi:hypothetical protein